MNTKLTKAMMASAALLALASGCTAQQQQVSSPAPSPTTATASTPLASSPSASPNQSANLYRGTVELLESRGKAQACLGIQESAPPVCKGIEIKGDIDWDVLKAPVGGSGELTYRMALAQIEGILSGETLTLTKPVEPPAAASPEPSLSGVDEAVLTQASDAVNKAIDDYYRKPSSKNEPRSVVVSTPNGQQGKGHLEILFLTSSKELQQDVLAAATKYIPRSAIYLSPGLTKVS